jgi:hypothetical protein
VASNAANSGPGAIVTNPSGNPRRSSIPITIEQPSDTPAASLIRRGRGEQRKSAVARGNRPHPARLRSTVEPAKAADLV